ncbi:hypothetical protein, partial [Aeromonas salmonicida]|uniref:hypothetical protein n=1 Tax=Aeromonas salmonicida TaxID=645 RepID=UPI001BB271A9
FCRQRGKLPSFMQAACHLDAGRARSNTNGDKHYLSSDLYPSLATLCASEKRDFRIEIVR